MAGRRPSPTGADGTSTCFGYTVDSTLRFRFLRGAGSGPALAVFEHDLPPTPTAVPPAMEWTRRPGFDLHVRLYAEAGGRHRMWTDREGWFEIDPVAQRIDVPACDDEIRREQRLWGIPAAICMLVNGDLPLHAAAVEIPGGPSPTTRSAVLLAAPGMFGKTTLASWFHRLGYRLLAEDMSLCRLSPSPAVLPGPAMLRMRRDMYERLGFPDGEVLVEEPNRVHLALADHRRGGGDPVPIAGVMLLRAGEGAPSVERVPPERALPDLWTLSFKLSDDPDRARCFDRIARLVAEVPVYNLHRALRTDNLSAVVEAIVATCADV